MWLYYDWASGDDDPNDNQNNTFNQLFPLGHAYLGLIDKLLRQNISDINIRLVTSPTKKLKLIGAMHWMDLATDNDALYNVAAARLGTPGTGKEIGEELDLVASYQLNPNFNVQLGYFWFWNGTFIDNNLPRDTATQFYLQTVLRY